MKRSNLVKGILCGLMLTTVMGSVAFAKTDTYSEHVGINNSHEKTFAGSVGRYTAQLRRDRYNGDFRVIANSTTTKEKYYTVQSARMDKKGNYTVDSHGRAAILSKNGNKNQIIAAVGRDPNEEFNCYYGCAITYNNASVYSGVCDDFSWTIYPFSK